MGEKRSNVETAEDILYAVTNPSTQADIIKRTGINSTIFRNYIGQMLDDELILIIIEDGSNRYNITPKGKDYLTSVSELKKLAPKTLER